MTNRVEQPDTPADIELRDYLDQPQQRCFVMVAGAGSGKTTSLVKALAHLSATRADDLRKRGQKIACITYTEIAAREIWEDVGNNPLFHVSTIHSFLWTVIHPFQNDMRGWIQARLQEKIAEAQAKLDNPKTRANTKAKAERDIERYQHQHDTASGIESFRYGTSSDYANGILGHADILKIGSTFIGGYPLLRKLISKRFPVIFVDESQDTNPELVIALKEVVREVGAEFCLGFFGDAMQKIYTTGAGPIALEQGWAEIRKPENFRCPTRVLDVINRLRAEGDGLEQTRGRTIVRDGVEVPVEGTARVFILPADERRTERVAQVRHWLATANGDPLWEDDGRDADVRVLVLVHKMAAQRLGFPNVFRALNDGAPPGLKDGLRDGTTWVARPFLSILLPLVTAERDGDKFEVISAMRKHCPLLHKDRLRDLEVPQLLETLNGDLGRLTAMFADGSGATIKDVLAFVRDRGIATIDERFIPYLDTTDAAGGADEDNAEARSIVAFLSCAATELWGYKKYVDDESPFSTQQGVKGAEFNRVLVILDDEEGDYNLFSYGKYFGLTALSETDQKNIDQGADSVVDRTRRLFYVCCSRAEGDLAVILFVPDVAAACAALEAKAYFRPEDVLSVEAMELATG